MSLALYHCRMSAPSFASVLAQLEDELFFAILDVALDIGQALSVQSAKGSVYIDAVRDAIRYPILYPAVSVNLTYRYVDLRRNGLAFLQKYSLIDSMEYRKWGMSGWEARWEVTVSDPARIEKTLIELRKEEDRRVPRPKTQQPTGSAMTRLVKLTDSFQRATVRLRDRRAGREPLLIKDEYDVQYLFSALLETQFEDVRPEEWGPSYAGKPTRVDFLLKDESVLLETKMTRDGLTDGRLGEELIVDIDHYKQRPDCKYLFCFVYDPDHRLKNPRGLENDLSKEHGHLKVAVIVQPK